MYYEIQSRTRKRPAWQVIYIVPPSGDSAPARFQGKVEAKNALRRLRETDALTNEYRTPSTRREYRIERVETEVEEAAYISPEMAVAYL